MCMLSENHEFSKIVGYLICNNNEQAYTMTYAATWRVVHLISGLRQQHVPLIIEALCLNAPSKSVGCGE